ncbi:TPA: LOW QUALITY PROTEIN: hypothetical protein N0F65_004990 [Lagenidium giganteum]|uniref:Integrase catalytic domain-containing protein n=1 Tax=Lagenidium giganteum TaxID=4803 RepID=A0AAV2ZHV8_9STRA|nr:TPA: LOW QUALITY PROTEIN: hypothetical protein N0F65_004990 [Lagenidium giganteum]
MIECETNPQYLKMMVDRGLVNGTMITQRGQKPCDSCHAGKQKCKRHRKKLDRKLTAPSPLVFADLLFHGRHNGTRYAAALVIMDDWSRYLTVHLLTNKSSTTMNTLMQQYIVWEERQAGRGLAHIPADEQSPERFQVKRVLTDKGDEFGNAEMEAWYAARGIEHVKVGPKRSHLNAYANDSCGVFPLIWPYALNNATYIKNRVYSKPIEGIPYERMFGVKSDVHRIRKFGALAYTHILNTPDRHKSDDNTVSHSCSATRKTRWVCKLTHQAQTPSSLLLTFGYAKRSHTAIVTRLNQAHVNGFNSQPNQPQQWMVTLILMIPDISSCLGTIAREVMVL